MGMQNSVFDPLLIESTNVKPSDTTDRQYLLEKKICVLADPHSSRGRSVRNCTRKLKRRGFCARNLERTRFLPSTSSQSSGCEYKSQFCTSTLLLPAQN